MTPTVLLGLAVAAVVALLLVLRWASRHARAGRAVDFGAVSTRWLSELRRDEPWTRS